MPLRNLIKHWQYYEGDKQAIWICVTPEASAEFHSCLWVKQFLHFLQSW